MAVLQEQDLGCDMDDLIQRHKRPWRQLGFHGPEECWVACRKPIADFLVRDGSLLDIACAHGYLLECLTQWAGERGVSIFPFGLDGRRQWVSQARRRHVDFFHNFYVGDPQSWRPHRQFDYVRTDLEAVAEGQEANYLERLLIDYVKPQGKLIVTQYRTLNNSLQRNDRVDDRVREWGFKIEEIHTGSYGGLELMRACSIEKR